MACPRAPAKAGHQLRRFVVPSFLHVTLAPGRALGEAFHITRHREAYPWRQIAAEVGRALGAEAKLAYVPTDTLIRYNPQWRGPLLGDKTWSVLFDNSKVQSVAGEFVCQVSLAEGLAGAARHYRKRAAAYRPDPDLHALLDRIVAEQSALGRH